MLKDLKSMMMKFSMKWETLIRRLQKSSAPIDYSANSKDLDEIAKLNPMTVRRKNITIKEVELEILAKV